MKVRRAAWVVLLALIGCSGPPPCETKQVESPRACRLEKMAADVPLTITLSADGCGRCGHEVFVCRVTQASDHIAVEFEETFCPPESGECPAICLLPKVSCTLPALSAGAYSLAINGTKIDFEVAAGGETEANCS